MLWKLNEASNLSNIFSDYPGIQGGRGVLKICTGMLKVDVRISTIPSYTLESVILWPKLQIWNKLGAFLAKFSKMYVCSKYVLSALQCYFIASFRTEILPLGGGRSGRKCTKSGLNNLNNKLWKKRHQINTASQMIIASISLGLFCCAQIWRWT